MMVFVYLRSAGTHDWVVPDWTETACCRSRNKRALQALHRTTRNGDRRRTSTHRRYTYRRIFCRRRNQRRAYLLTPSHTHTQLTLTRHAYIQIQDGTETRKTFLHAPSAIEAEEAEEIGVEHLLRDIKDSTTTTLATRVSEQLASLRGLAARLSDVQRYLGDVARGAAPVNHQVVYLLQDALNLLPDLADPALTTGFASTTNDALLVVYLSSLLRAVIALHALVDNKATVSRAELEEDGGAKDKEKEKEKAKAGEGEKEKDSASKKPDAKST